MLRSFFARPFFAPDDGAPTGGDSTSAPPATGGEPGTNTPTGDATGQAPAPASGDKPEKTFSQVDLDRIVKERLAEEQQRSTKRAQQEAAKAKEDALRQSGEWQTIAEARASELVTLQGASERAEAYAKALNDTIKAQTADWPEEVKALDPGKDNLEARLAWVKSAAPLAERLKQAPKAPDTEAGAGNRRPPDGAASTSEQTQKYRFQKSTDITW